VAHYPEESENRDSTFGVFHCNRIITGEITKLRFPIAREKEVMWLSETTRVSGIQVALDRNSGFRDLEGK
jgi:hypothetical protein